MCQELECPYWCSYTVVDKGTTNEGTHDAVGATRSESAMAMAAKICATALTRRYSHLIWRYQFKPLRALEHLLTSPDGALNDTPASSAALGPDHGRYSCIHVWLALQLLPNKPPLVPIRHCG